MRGSIICGNYETPYQHSFQRKGSFLVERSGKYGQFLTIAKVKADLPVAEWNPMNIRHCETMIGILTQCPEQDPSELLFLLCRHIPRDYKPSVSFFPTEGSVMVKSYYNKPSLIAWGRHSHRWERRDTIDVPLDVPHSQASSEGNSSAWYMELKYKKWPGEMTL